MVDLRDKDQTQRIKLLEEIQRWSSQRPPESFSTLLIREGVYLTQDKVNVMDTHGEVLEEQWLWVFQDVTDAVYFKMRWG